MTRTCATSSSAQDAGPATTVSIAKSPLGGGAAGPAGAAAWSSMPSDAAREAACALLLTPILA